MQSTCFVCLIPEKRNRLINSPNATYVAFKPSSKYSDDDVNFQSFKIYLNKLGVDKHLRSLSIGYLNADSTLNKCPAFSFGKGLQISLFFKNLNRFINFFQKKKLLDGLILVMLFHLDQYIVLK